MDSDIIADADIIAELSYDNRDIALPQSIYIILYTTYVIKATYIQKSFVYSIVRMKKKGENTIQCISSNNGVYILHTYLFGDV